MGKYSRNSGKHTTKTTTTIFNRITFKFMITVGLVVAVLIASFFLFIFDRTQDHIISEVHNQAEIAFEQIVITRHWNTNYGGVYVEKTAGVVSDPYLEKIGIEPDIITVDNRTYTLKNPALMTRELSSIAKEGEVLEFHITSLNLVNPSNRPDEFEKESLMSFDNGITETTQIVLQNGSMSYQYMAPLYVVESCLKCHKNYELGDVRGGISVFLPMDNAYSAIQSTKRNLLVCAVVLIIGIEGLLFFLINRMIVKPIDNLRIGARKIGEGDFKYTIPVKNGDEIGVLSTAFNTMASELAKTMRDVKESEAKWHTIFTDSLEGIALIDSETGQIFDCNPEFEKQTERKLEILKSMKIWDLVLPENVDAVVAKFHEIVKTGIGCSHELEFQRPDGGTIPMESVSGVVTVQEKRYVLCLTRDLTERKQAEEKLKMYAEDLKRSNELKDLFTDILRHDLLNPAGLVKGFTEVLICGENDEKKLYSLQKIKDNNNRLIGLIESTAKLARLEYIKELKFEKKDVGAIFKEVVDDFRPNLDEKQMTLTFAAEGTYPANVNPIIEEVFVNLLSNATKYSPNESQIIVDILDSGDKWKVTVTDFGTGISDQDKTQIFERFKRVDKSGVKGTGLGLAIIKRIIELHCGDVGVDDNPAGQGSVFWVTVRKA